MAWLLAWAKDLAAPLIGKRLWPRAIPVLHNWSKLKKNKVVCISHDSKLWKRLSSKKTQTCFSPSPMLPYAPSYPISRTYGQGDHHMSRKSRPHTPGSAMWPIPINIHCKRRKGGNGARGMKACEKKWREKESCPLKKSLAITHHHHLYHSLFLFKPSLSLSLGPPSNTHRGTIAVCAHDGQINACQCSAPMRCFCRVPATHDDARKGQGNEIMYELVCGDPG